MQLSVKTPPELTRPTLEKCAVLGCEYPSAFVADCTSQCLQVMNAPHDPFHPLHLVSRYYFQLGCETEIFDVGDKKQDPLILELAVQDRKKRHAEAQRRFEEFEKKHKKVPKHLHLKISDGAFDLPERIRRAAVWLRMPPNAFVVACLRDCLEAMDDPKKAVVPPPIVVDFWTASHAQAKRKPKDAIDALVMQSYETMLRERAVPIFDTILRLVQKGEWNATLKEIMDDADVFPDNKKPPKKKIIGKFGEQIAKLFTRRAGE